MLSWNVIDVSHYFDQDLQGQIELLTHCPPGDVEVIKKDW